MTFEEFQQVIRDRVHQVMQEETLSLVEAMFRVEEEVSSILGVMVDDS